MKKQAPFRQVDVTRAIRGALAAGLKITRAEVDQHGKIVLMAGEDLPTPENALDKWLSENAN